MNPELGCALESQRVLFARLETLRTISARTLSQYQRCERSVNVGPLLDAIQSAIAAGRALSSDVVHLSRTHGRVVHATEMVDDDADFEDGGGHG